VAKRLIVTADDFGYSSAVNRAVIRAFKDGILRFTSLMVHGAAAEEAARLAKENPGLGVGLHVELCADRPAYWGFRYFADPSARARIEPMIAAQFERFLSLGLKPTHADGHINIHVHPTIFPILADLARRYGVPRLRLPGGEWPSARAHDGFSAGRAAEAAVFSLLRSRLRSRAEGLAVPERTWGLLRSGLMGEDYVLRLLADLPDGLTEIYFHPSDDPASRVTGRVPAPTHQTVTELETLLSPRVRDAVARLGIELVSAAG
jgi:chitin disaccharide deacetylase